MSISERVQAMDREQAKAVLAKLLEKTCSPAFGSLPKRELEILLFDAMLDLGVISRDASIYEIMTDLRVSRTKAQQLLFDSLIRTTSSNEALLDVKVIDAVCRSRLVKESNFYLIEIENPMIHARLKELARKSGHLTDTSFNSSIIRLSFEAISGIIAELLPESKRESVRKELVKAGAPDKSLQGVLTAAVSALAKKVAGEALGQVAGDVVGSVGDWLAPIFSDASGKITSVWANVFSVGVVKD